MVPFSFKSELSYSRVMKIQLLPSVTSVTLDPIVGAGARLARTLAPPKGQLDFVEIL